MANLADISALVHRELGFRDRTLTPDLRLRRDLGIDGKRGERFLEAFGSCFSVDLGGFRPRRFFSVYEMDLGPYWPEFTWVFRWFNRRFRHAWDNALAYEISLAHLTEVAQQRRWFDPPPQPHLDRPRLSSPKADRAVAWLGSILLLPYRVLTIGIIAAIIFGSISSMIEALGALASMDWQRLLYATLAFAFFALFGVAIAYKTAQAIQTRLGDDPV